MDMQKMFSLEGKTALVTGGAYGIGFAIAEALATQAGVEVSSVDVYIDGIQFQS